MGLTPTHPFTSAYRLEIMIRYQLLTVTNAAMSSDRFIASTSIIVRLYTLQRFETTIPRFARDPKHVLKSQATTYLGRP
jgi:hypothetical protein